jgi:hypothetical protein
MGRNNFFIFGEAAERTVLTLPFRKRALSLGVF